MRRLYDLSPVTIPERPTEDDHRPLPAPLSEAIVVRARDVEDGDLVVADFNEKKDGRRVADYFYEPYIANIRSLCGECAACVTDRSDVADVADAGTRLAVLGYDHTAGCEIWPANAPVLILPGPWTETQVAAAISTTDEDKPEAAQEEPEGSGYATVADIGRAVAALLGSGWTAWDGPWGVTSRLSGPTDRDQVVIQIHPHLEEICIRGYGHETFPRGKPNSKDLPAVALALAFLIHQEQH
ncbi:hypothetical protein [Streptomyces sp. NPDC049879]|uniref:hypothetical protein n=1 Tax=Streptomyces sp. NPDC049879 TaxID=3365598 RepID=UPI00378DED8E